MSYSSYHSKCCRKASSVDEYHKLGTKTRAACIDSSHPHNYHLRQVSVLCVFPAQKAEVLVLNWDPSQHEVKNCASRKG